MIVTLEVELPDDALARPDGGVIDAIAVVYETPRGVESSLRVFPESLIPSTVCALAVVRAAQDYGQRLAARMNEAPHA